MNKFKQAIIEAVERKQGAKMTDIAVEPDVVMAMLGMRKDGSNVADLVQEIIDDGDVVEVEYKLPGSDYRRSFLLPAGSIVRVSGEK